MYIEKHIGFTAAYGLTLGFMLVAAATAAVGGRWYGTFAPSKRLIDEDAHIR